jgi:putative ABC transport system permease protein
MLLMIAAIAASLVGLGAVLGAWGVLSREISVNYLGTRPAAATLELPGGVDGRVLEEVRAHPAVAGADSREVVLGRVRVGEDWRPLLLFVADDFSRLELNVFRSESGAWPPPTGTVLIERSARSMARADQGDTLLVKTPHGDPREVPISGIVHDPGLAPAWQEREVYAYATRDTLAALGENPALHELRISFRSEPRDIVSAQAAAEDLAGWLVGRGHQVHEIRVPPPRQHPHQRQMTTVLLLLMTFAVLALVLGSVVVATTVAAMLARQVREIGVMKTLGARTAQLAVMYAVLVGLLGSVAFVVALPLGLVGARGFSSSVASMLNFDLTDATVPWWVFATQAFGGIVVPLILAWFPIRRATRASVRAALDDYGAAPEVVRSIHPRLPVPARNVLRRPRRFALTVGLLAAGGALFTTASALSRAWERNLDKMYATRHYDLEVRFQAPQSPEVAERIAEVRGVRSVELWAYAAAAFARPGRIDVVRTYPDRGHGSLAVLGPPPGTHLIDFPVLRGHWLRADDAEGVVLNHAAAAQAGQPAVGSEVLLSFEGVATRWKVVGVVEEIGAAGVAYVTDAAFARAAGTNGGARMARVVTDATTPSARIDVVRRTEEELRRSRVGVETVVPFSELRTAVGDHVTILIQALTAMALIFAVVGLIGLGSAVGVSVVERTREIGVMKTVGATSRRILRLILGEALITAATSWIVAMLASIPLTWAIEGLIGRLGFLAPLPFTLSPHAMAAWLWLLGAATVVAALPPARRAARLTVREAVADASG